MYMKPKLNDIMGEIQKLRHDQRTTERAIRHVLLAILAAKQGTEVYTYL